MRKILLLLLVSVNAGAEEPVGIREFNAMGFNQKHYNFAKELNLDLDNYVTFRENLANRIKGRIMTGVGAGFSGVGVFYGLFGFQHRMLYLNHEEKPYYYYDDYGYSKSYYRSMSIVYFGTAAVFGTAGVVLLAIGIEKLSNISPVFTKNGTQITLVPTFDFNAGGVGAQLALRY